MKPLIVLGVATVTGLGAQASPCSAGHFTDEHGKTYLSAETALLEDEAPGRAVSILDTRRPPTSIATKRWPPTG